MNRCSSATVGFARALHDVEALGDRLHDAVLDAVVDHLDEVARADGAAVQVAVFGGAAAFATRRALDRAAARRERLEDRIEPRHDLGVAADHHAVAALEAVDAAARAGVDVAELLRARAPSRGGRRP